MVTDMRNKGGGCGGVFFVGGKRQEQGEMVKDTEEGVEIREC